MQERTLQQMLAQAERTARVLFVVGIVLNVIWAAVNSSIAGTLSNPYASNERLGRIFVVLLALGFLFNIFIMIGIHHSRHNRKRLLESWYTAQEPSNLKLYELHLSVANHNTSIFIGIIFILACAALGVPLLILF